KFQLAADLYQPFGPYKDAKHLATRYQQQGQVTLYIPNSEFRPFVAQQFADSGITLTEQATQADVTLNIIFNLPKATNIQQASLTVQATGAISYTRQHSLLKSVEYSYPVYR